MSTHQTALELCLSGGIECYGQQSHLAIIMSVARSRTIGSHSASGILARLSP